VSELECSPPAGIAAAATLCKRYGKLALGLVDASMVVLAKRWSTTAMAMLDERHFRVVQPLQGGAFELHPADAD
jgi:uncharacterized protein